MRRACIDIGSNTTRLLVADLDGSSLAPVHEERSFTRVGAGIDELGVIAGDKLDEVARVVAAQTHLARQLGAAQTRCVATASVREAVNAVELVDRVQALSPGLVVEILSGEQEARLAFIGAARTLTGPCVEPLAVLDVGGGSSELAVGHPPDQVDWWFSFALGSGALTGECLPSDPPRPDELTAARTRVGQVLDAVQLPAAGTAVAVGGSATSLRRLAGDLLSAVVLQDVLRTVCGGPAATLAPELGLDPVRVRLLPAGLLILAALSDRLGTPLQIGLGGLREGALLDT